MKKTFKDRIEKGVMRRLLDLPRPLATRIFGDPPVNDRGDELELQTHILMRLIELTNQPEIADMSVGAARRLYVETNAAMDVAPARLFSVTHRTIPGPTRDLQARIYRPRPGVHPAIVFWHGGGFVVGDVPSYAGICSNLAEWSGCTVIAVSYRLAPEHPFPAAVEDAASAFRWIAQHAEELEVDPQRLAVAGDSAGANLAAVTSHITAEDDVAPALQALFYPTTDYDPGYPSIDMFAEGYFLTGRNMMWFTEHYMQGQEVADERIAPIILDDFSELPPAYLLTAGFDPLRDEGEAYGEKLREAGVEVTHDVAPGLVHGFMTMGGVLREARRTSERMARTVGDLLRNSGNC